MRPEGLADLAREVPVRRPSAAELELLRAGLLVSARREPIARATRRFGPGWQIAAAAAVLVAVLGVAWNLRRMGPPPLRAEVEASSGAQFVHTLTTGNGTQADEVVRLKQGRVHLEVHKLAPNERFRVVVGDGEIEVRGTAFTAEATADRLEHVHVEHGLVEVRPRGGEVTVLGAGESWDAPSAGVRVAPEQAAPTLLPQPRPRAAVSRPAAPAPVEVAEATPVTAPAVPAVLPTEAERAFSDGWDALRTGRLDAAVEAFRRASSAEPSGPLAEDAEFWEAVALARGEHRELARVAMTSFLGRRPQAARAAELSVMLGWLLLDAGDKDGARVRFQAAVGDPKPAVREGARKGLAATGSGR